MTDTLTRCMDRKCTDGITECRDCNGWGKTSPRGGRYRYKCREIPAWAIDHDVCHGTGMVACGCVELAPAEIAVIEGRGAEYVAAIELDEIEAQRAGVAA